MKELRLLKDAGVDYEGRIFLSDRAHLVFDFHQQVCLPSLSSSHFCRLMGYKKHFLLEINLEPLARESDRLIPLKPHETVE